MIFFLTFEANVALVFAGSEHAVQRLWLHAFGSFQHFVLAPGVLCCFLTNGLLSFSPCVEPVPKPGHAGRATRPVGPVPTRMASRRDSDARPGSCRSMTPV